MTARPKVDFAKIDFEQGWHRPEGAPEGVSVKILAGALDHVAKQGHCTTLPRWRSGTEVTQANSYVCRSAGVPHGPFRADEDYLAIEFCYYDDAGR